MWGESQLGARPEEWCRRLLLWLLGGGGDEFHQLLAQTLAAGLFVAKDDGFGHPIGGLEVVPDAAGDEGGAASEDEAACRSADDPVDWFTYA